MKAKDERTKSSNELFYSIKFVKINALEDFFVKKLLILRDIEISLIQKEYIVTAFSVLSVWISPLLIQNATFTMYVLLGNNLTPANTFAIISIF
jgi:hypothetical protein